jgi:dolichol-phosphate mannosyltransferase
MRLLIAAVAVTLALLGLRLDAARAVGFSDTEALFLAYGLHPQAAYVSYPGLIGGLARLLPPSPFVVHLATTLAAGALPWAGVLAAWASGAPLRLALRSYFPLALLPPLCIGAFAFTPDLPQCYLWLAALGCMGFALRRPAASFGALLASIGVGTAVGLACLAKPSGWILAACLAAVALGRSERARLRTLAPWAAFGLFAIITTPLVSYWRSHGLGVQLDPALSGARALMQLGRPLLGVTPPFLVAGVLIASDLLRRRNESAVDRSLASPLLFGLLPLAALAACTSAETDWLSPAYVVLSLHVARMPELRRSLGWTCVLTGLGIAGLGWCWLRTSLPLAAGQWLGGYDPTLDASNDYYAWLPEKQLLEEAVADVRERTGQSPVVIGPHWSVCAQAEIALAGQVHVGCDSIERDDYDDWSSPTIWDAAQTLLFVTDSRFDAPPDTFFGRDLVSMQRTVVERFGQAVRTISVSRFDRQEGTAMAPRPAR